MGKWADVNKQGNAPMFERDPYDSEKTGLRYRVSFRHEGVKKYVWMLDDTYFMHLTKDSELAGDFSPEETELLVRAIICDYLPANLVVDKVGLTDENF